jgi:hypothetical protein
MHQSVWHHLACTFNLLQSAELSFQQQHSRSYRSVLSSTPIGPVPSWFCRICLEEDALSNLETPCGCTGTQRHAHKECIQKWVNEKHHTTCEICDQPYQGEGTGVLHGGCYST